MKKLNNRGIAISSILYTLLVLLLALIFGIMGLVLSGKSTFDTLKSDVFNKLNNVEKYEGTYEEEEEIPDEEEEEEIVDYIGKDLLTYTEHLLDENWDQYMYMDGTYLGGMQDANYLWYRDNLYRIMGITADGNIKLISESSLTSLSVNINRYEDTLDPDWSNYFYDSYIYEWINDYFQYDIASDFLTETTYCTYRSSDLFSGYDYCSTSNSAIAAIISLDEYRLAAIHTAYSCEDIGLKLYRWENADDGITLDDFQSYLSSSSTTCMAYVQETVSNNEYAGMSASYNEENNEVYFSTSYLDDSNIDSFWTLTSYDSTFSSGGSVLGAGSGIIAKGLGTVGVSYLMQSFGIRPIITFLPDTIIIDGDGTIDNPIIIE